MSGGAEVQDQGEREEGQEGGERQELRERKDKGKERLSENDMQRAAHVRSRRPEV